MSNGDLYDLLTIARNHLRDCYWWRRLADPNNAWDDATALAHIHLDALPPPATGPDHSLAELLALRPFAIMWVDISGGMQWRTSTGDFCCPTVGGTIVIQLEIPVPSALASQPTALALELNKQLGRIVRTSDPAQPGLLDLSGQSGYLPIVDAKISGYIRTDEKAAKTIGDAITCEIELRWGVTDN